MTNSSCVRRLQLDGWTWGHTCISHILVLWPFLEDNPGEQAPGQ